MRNLAPQSSQQPFNGDNENSSSEDLRPDSNYPQQGHQYQNDDVYPAPRNPFLSDHSDNNSVSSDQYLYNDYHQDTSSSSHLQSQTQQHLYNDDGYTSNSNPDLIYPHQQSSYPDQNAYIPRESTPLASAKDHDLSHSHHPLYSAGLASPMGMSTAAAVAGSAAAVAGASASLLAAPSAGPSSTSLNAMSSAEYDRYPNRISSAHSIASVAAPLLRGQGSDNYLGHAVRTSTISNESGASSMSDSSVANPFVVNADFSPFGGYPATSFPLHIDEKEADDYLHNPDPILDAQNDRMCHKPDKRGWTTILAMICLIIGGIVLFIVYPVLTYTGLTEETTATVVQSVEVLTNYEYNILSAIRTSLIDPDTPSDVRNFTALDGSRWTLAFSDEFNKEGRTFYDGDDQFWTAPDIHYAATKDLEWYDPDASITENGTLVLTMDAFKNHDLYYRSGMLQSWNKMCFTQGYLEVSAQLAGYGHILGLWPGIWTLGNLGRPGYLASTEGVWPYCYSQCDAGITPNQSSTDGISYLKGQKLNACTCSGADHPNPGTGRGAPEIDALEGTVSSDLKTGVVSQSLQLAPYDIWYMPDMNFIEIYNKTTTVTNTWFGGPLQQAISMASTLNTTWYEYGSNPSFQSYGFEYMNDDQEGYIRWFVGKTPTHTLYAPTIGPNGNVGQREISKEPMSIILNLGISTSWVYIDWPSLVWPSHMRIDYVRIYQPSDAISITCDTDDYPTYDYIQNHLNAYSNPNLTTWEDTGYDWPKNKLTGC